MTVRPSFLDNLHKWANDAADRQVDDNIPLTDTVFQTAKDNGLLPEQIKRICELANHRMFSRLFQSGSDKVFDFPIADHSVIIMMLQKKPDSMPSTSTPTQVCDTNDYESAPSPSMDKALLDQVFGSMFPQRDAPDIPFLDGESPERRAIIIRINKTAAALSELQTQKMAAEVSLNDKDEEIYNAIKQMILKGKTLEDAFNYFSNLYPAVELAAATGSFNKILDRLKEENIVNPDASVDSSDITPKIVNKESPTAQAIVDAQKIAHQIDIIKMAEELVESDLGDLHKLLNVTGGPLGRRIAR